MILDDAQNQIKAESFAKSLLFFLVYLTDKSHVFLDVSSLSSIFISLPLVLLSLF